MIYSTDFQDARGGGLYANAVVAVTVIGSAEREEHAAAAGTAIVGPEVNVCTYLQWSKCQRGLVFGNKTAVLARAYC